MEIGTEAKIGVSRKGASALFFLLSLLFCVEVLRMHVCTCVCVRVTAFGVELLDLRVFVENGSNL